MIDRNFIAGMFFGAALLLGIASKRHITMVFRTVDGKYLDIQRESWLEAYVERRYTRETRDATTGEICDLPFGTTIYASGETFKFYEPEWKRIYSTNKEYPIEN